MDHSKKSKCIRTYCKRAVKKTRTALKKMSRTIRKKLKKEPRNPDLQRVLSGLQQSENDVKEMVMYACKLGYCNPGCQGTIFEDGEPDFLAPALLKEITDKDNLDFLRESRRRMFGKKKSVLRDKSFYQGLSASTIHALRRDGAISGCTIGLT